MKKFKLILIIISLIFMYCKEEKISPDNAKYINPFIGTDAHGHTYPGATLPFGMVQLSPDNGTAGWDWSSGYNYSDSLIAGFSHTHLSGTGVGDLYDISFIPAIIEDDLPVDSIPSQKFISKFSHSKESAKAGYYSVFLELPQTKVELTATERCGFQKYTFPKIKNSAVVLDLGFNVNWDTPTETVLKIIDDSTIAGYRYSTGWAKIQRVYFYAKFSKSFYNKYLISNNSTIVNSHEILSDETKGIFLFDTIKDEVVMIKTGISNVSIESAKRNLEKEIPHWDFDNIRENAYEIWKNELNKITVESDDEDLKKVFYTALYRTYLVPNLFSDVDGAYKMPNDSIYFAKGYNRYTIFSLWDTFRTWHPLITIIKPEIVNDLINSMLEYYNETGLLPSWELWGNETNTMIGYHAVPVIADAILKGFTGFDHQLAFEAMKASAMQNNFGIDHYRKFGYIPYELEKESVSKTLEYAYDDWCIAMTAKYLNKQEDHEYYLNKSQNYKNVFDKNVLFMRGKDSKGNWFEPFNPRFSNHRDDVYTEGNAWQYSWFVPHDVEGLINLFGNKESFVSKLDSLFNEEPVLEGENVSVDISGLIGQYAHGNEPSHHIAYLYNFAGYNHKTQERVREIMKTQYNHTPEGLSGNEDCGQMSAWYVMSAMGFYPVNPADQKYHFGTPAFKELKILLNNGKEFKIKTDNFSKENFYVNKVTLNDQLLERNYITHDEIISGGELTFYLSNKPKK